MDGLLGAASVDPADSVQWGCHGGHTDEFLGLLDSTVEYLYSKFGEFSFLLLSNSV